MRSRHQAETSSRAHPLILPILNKWSTKIQAASVQPGSKQVGGSKFLQSTKTGAGGIVEAIEAGLTSKVGVSYTVSPRLISNQS